MKKIKCPECYGDKYISVFHHGYGKSIYPDCPTCKTAGYVYEKRIDINPNKENLYRLGDRIKWKDKNDKILNLICVKGEADLNTDEYILYFINVDYILKEEAKKRIGVIESCCLRLRDDIKHDKYSKSNKTLEELTKYSELIGYDIVAIKEIFSGKH